MAKEALSTVLSTKGQVILPKAVRDRHNWKAGTRLTVEDNGDTVVLRKAPIFKPTKLEDVVGILKYDGPPKTLEEMDAAITEEILARRARGRY